ncbi:MAG: hypothetical protein R3A46_07575 [Thermomicrobiales bacterium]
MIAASGRPTAPNTGIDVASSSRRNDSSISVHRSLLIRILGALALLFLVTDLAVQTIDAEWHPDAFIWPHIVRFVDLNREVSLPTWFSVSMLSSAALLAGIIATAAWSAGDRYRRHWAALAILFAGFSIDEGAQIHDSQGSTPLREIVGTDGLFYYAWVIPAGISALIAAIVFARFILALPPTTRRLFILSAVTFVVGAIGFEMVSGWFTENYPDAQLGYATLTSLEEFFEMSGAILLIAGLLDYASQRLGQTILIWTTEPSDRTRPTAPGMSPERGG